MRACRCRRTSRRALDHLPVILLGAALAAFVQGLSGFGFSMTAIAVWAWVLDPMLTATLGVFGSLAGQVFTMITTRRGFGWRAVMPFLLGALAGLPLGLWLLPRMDIPLYKAVLGAVLVVTCPLMFLAPRLPKVTHGGKVADGVSGAVGGIMGGLGGVTGVVPTLWCTLRGYAKDDQRSIIQNFNLATLAVTFATYLASGLVTRDVLPVFAAMVPAIVLPSLLGRKIYAAISEQGFRKVVLGLLTAAGVTMLGSALPVLLARA